MTELQHTDAFAKLVTLKSCTDATATSVSAELKKKITRHEDGAGRAAVSCTEATTPDTRTDLSISAVRHDEEAWPAPERRAEKAQLTQGAKLPKKEPDHT